MKKMVCALALAAVIPAFAEVPMGQMMYSASMKAVVMPFPVASYQPIPMPESIIPKGIMVSVYVADRAPCKLVVDAVIETEDGLIQTYHAAEKYLATASETQFSVVVVYTPAKVVKVHKLTVMPIWLGQEHVF